MGRLIVSGGGATLAVAGTIVATRTLVRHQARIARGTIGAPFGESAWPADRTYRRRFDGQLDLVVLGDSMAAGLGADRPRHTLGARLAKGLGKRTRCAVRLTTVAQVGAESPWLPDQLARLPGGYRPDVAVIVIGGNDVTHGIPISESIRHLGACIDDLRARGAVVVVGTCPDLGALTAVPQPLRTLASRASRRLAAAQRRAAHRHGAYVVSLGSVLRPVFAAEPEVMFSQDRFHPSSAGYQRAARAILPVIVTALEDVAAFPAPAR
ncbi:MAG: SGNH/GDSL hydrolase family protein [Austwickia sp.]|nr:SGNH/GDSL hydrolase family protein [Austwickia sp.]MBK8437165.1 SGNH/GDSL hydrolase family protein [Austwickia sp.]